MHVGHQIDKVEQALERGDAQMMDDALQMHMGISQDRVRSVLSRAIERNQVDVVAVLLDNAADFKKLSQTTLRNIVLQEQKEIFCMLTKRGIGFDYLRDTDDHKFAQSLAYLKKYAECENLKEEIAQAGKDLTAQETPVAAKTTPLPSKTHP